MRVRLVPALVLAACTSTEPRPEPVTVPTPLPPAAIAEDPAPVISAAHWYWDEGGTSLDLENGPRIVGGPPLRVQLLRDRTVVLDRPVPGSESHDVGVVAATDDALYVAHHSSVASGASLTRISIADGEVVWSTQLRALGPVYHFKYRNRVQLAIEHGNPVVFGNESSGQYTEIVDARTGKTRDHALPPRALADAEWSFVRSPRSGIAPGGLGVEWNDVVPGPWTLPTTDGSFVFTEASEHDRHAKLERRSSDPTSAWKIELPGDAHCGHVAMQQLGDMLWIVRWCAIATGADLLGVDTVTAAIPVHRPLRALPDIGHSEYLNAVQLREIDGHPVVFGNEAGGRYLEAIDPDNGLTLVSRTWK